jgi:hypothetical protein
MHIHVKDNKVETDGHPRTKCVTSLLREEEVIAGLQSKWVLQKKGCMRCMSFQRAAAPWRSMYMEENIAESGVGMSFGETLTKESKNCSISTSSSLPHLPEVCNVEEEAS